MAKPWVEEIVHIRSEDGLLLEGAVISPANGATQSLPIIWIHGLTGRFYAPSAINIGRELASRGFTFVTGNNRGHDFGALLNRADGEQLLAGGAWEHFDESPRDVAAWIDFAVGLGFSGVALLGHSLGALKVAYYQAARQDPRVAGLIAASPPARAGRVDSELLAQAKQMVAEGRGRDLLPWGSRSTGGGTMSASAYLNRMETNVDVYGDHTPDPAVARIRCPVLAFYGTNEPTVGGAADLETIKRNARVAPRVDTHLFEGADHSYLGHHIEVARVIAEWVAGLV
ncbi:MAG TPA: alpha/beta fold hydrolase [Chloroflexota bacterium]|jgi:alpha-beta hydrolase superfamily lysophospholipase|nr:alpha/beta fold hydrolase [Chloroflexota bacterium]